MKYFSISSWLTVNARCFRIFIIPVYTVPLGGETRTEPTSGAVDGGGERERV